MNQLKFPNFLDFLRSWNSRRKRLRQIPKDEAFEFFFKRVGLLLVDKPQGNENPLVLLRTSRFAYGRLSTIQGHCKHS